eukprot:scaffold2578_cov136-Skeletonema_menzelii.AAC.7
MKKERLKKERAGMRKTKVRSQAEKREGADEDLMNYSGSLAGSIHEARRGHSPCPVVFTVDHDKYLASSASWRSWEMSH